MNPFVKFVLDLGPLIAFFGSYYALGILPATAIFMGATVLAGLITYLLTKKVSALIVFSAVVVLIFGGLTIWLKDDLFIKLKPTIYYAAVSMILSGGLALNRLVVKDVLDLAVHLKDEGWEKLTVRISIFYGILAVVNIYVAETYAFDTWLWFKVWGFIPLNFLFFMAQMPLFMRYEVKEPEDQPPTPV
ncbi:MAG: inner membrane-spanning protein YciB [Micropepsaceae bacterium]